MIKSDDCFWKTFARDFWLRSYRINSSNVIRSYHAELIMCIEFGWNNNRTNDVHITIVITRYEYCIMLKFKNTFYSIDSWWFSLKKKFDVYEHCHCSFISWLHDYIWYIEIIAFERKFFARWVLKTEMWPQKEWNVNIIDSKMFSIVKFHDVNQRRVMLNTLKFFQKMIQRFAL